MIFFYFSQTINNNVTILVNSSVDQNINYIVIGRTGEMLNNNEKVSKSKQNEIVFKAQSWMFPKIEILLYYIHFTGEIIYEIVNVEFDNFFQNKVDKLYYIYFII